MYFLKDLNFLAKDISTLIQQTVQQVNLNILDVIIIIVFLFYAFEGFSIGFIASFFDLISFTFSFIIGLIFYGFFAEILIKNFSMPQGFANAFGFFIAAFLSEIFINIILRKMFKILHSIFTRKTLNESKTHGQIFSYIKIFNRFFGILPGLASAFILLSFILTVIISLPFSPYLKRIVSSSVIGNCLISNTQGFEKGINTIFGGAINETLNFLTVEPESDDFINLNFKTISYNIDNNAEFQMLLLLNKERTSNGLSPLAIDESLREVARNHAGDMLERGYFSHSTPEGLSPFDRMTAAKVSFTYAGENLALAPNVTLSMQGLMNSPGHRANILSPNFNTIGIGVLDAGIYGEMFVQEFKD